MNPYLVHAKSVHPLRAIEAGGNIVKVKVKRHRAVILTQRAHKFEEEIVVVTGFRKDNYDNGVIWAEKTVVDAIHEEHLASNVTPKMREDVVETWKQKQQDIEYLEQSIQVARDKAGIATI